MIPLLPELFAERVRACPAAPAVVSGRGTVTYRELYEAALRTARALRARGVRTESVVGVLMAPGPDMVAALLGVWLAGGCYLPLDPLDPAERLRTVVGAAGAGVVVTDRDPSTQAAVLADLADLVHVPPPEAGDAEPGSEAQPREEAARSAGAVAEPGPTRATRPRQAAYMICTSGSTGTPKRVVIEHEGIANRVLWAVRSLELTAQDRVLQKTPLTFDPAGWEIFAPLVVGAPVTFGRAGAGRDPGQLVRSVREQRITVLQVVPSMLRLLAAEPGLAECGSLRALSSGGEELQAELCQSVLEHVDVAIWNTYGPTECSIDCLAARFDPAQTSGPVPIGAPIDNMRCHLVPAPLDEQAPDAPDAPSAPVGEEGRAAPLQELYACGPGVGRGYDGEPALTALSFVPDPGGPPGARMYRTGDLVRTRPDGAVEFAGRADAQVKINGVRVEPGEVEAALHTHPGVGEAAVRVVADARGTRRLVAWVVPSASAARGGADADVDAADVTGHLRTRLPPALVPALVVRVDALPRTAGGKVDRARLPEPDWTAPAEPSGRAQPRTAEEHAVLATWRDLLGTEEIGLDDDFFRLGGHSLMLIRLASQLAEVHGVEVEFRDLHYATTAREQAKLLGDALLARPVPRLPEGARLPLSHAQERFWVMDRMDAGSREYLLPIFVWLPASTAEETVRQALSGLADRHDALRTCYRMDADGLSAVVEPAVPVPLRTVESDPDGLGEAVGDTLAEGFDLAAAPLWRAALLRDGGPEQLLLIVCHHIISDGWSARIVEQELRERVAAIEQGRAPALGEPPLRYVDAVAWQRQRLTGEALAVDLDYWRRTLADLPALELPVSGARDAERRHDGAGVTFALPKDVVDALLDTGRRAGATPFTTFMTLWTVLLARAGGQWDFGVGAPHAGRSRPELHGLVGPFINMLVIRPRLAPDMAFADALEAVGRVCQEAFAHQAAPFEAVAEAAAPARDLSRTPLFQTMLTLSGDGLVGPPARERDLEVLAHAWSMARTDLALTLWPHDDGRYLGALEYASALFTASAAEELAAGLRTLAERFGADPGLLIGGPAQEPGPGDDPDPRPLRPHEETILRLVRELLGKDLFGFDDDFMDNGGNSLMAARLLWNVQQVFDVVVPMRAFFDEPSAAGLAGVVEALVRAESATSSQQHDGQSEKEGA